MSLIEEALRRVQEIPPSPAPRKEPAPQPTATTPHPQQPQPPQRSQPQPPPPRLPQPRQDSLPIAAPLPPQVATPPLPLTSFAVKWIGVGVLLAMTVGMALWTHRVMVTLKPVPRQLPEPPQATAPTSQTISGAPLAVASSPPSQPVAPPSTPQPPTLKLSGIVRGVGEPFAIINNHIVRLGEHIEGATLLAVNDESVKLQWSDEEVVLRTAQ